MEQQQQEWHRRHGQLAKEQLHQPAACYNFGQHHNQQHQQQHQHQHFLHYDWQPADCSAPGAFQPLEARSPAACLAPFHAGAPDVWRPTAEPSQDFQDQQAQYQRNSNGAQQQQARFYQQPALPPADPRRLRPAHTYVELQPHDYPQFYQTDQRQEQAAGVGYQPHQHQRLGVEAAECAEFASPTPQCCAFVPSASGVPAEVGATTFGHFAPLEQQQQQQHLEAGAAAGSWPQADQVAPVPVPVEAAACRASGQAAPREPAVAGTKSGGRGRDRRGRSGAEKASASSDRKEALAGAGAQVGGRRRSKGRIIILPDGTIVRRKNATRETTALLKDWLEEHGANPYPSKGEKVMLAVISSMTLTQISTWYANARRRLKKANKALPLTNFNSPRTGVASTTSGAGGAGSSSSPCVMMGPMGNSLRIPRVCLTNVAALKLLIEHQRFGYPPAAIAAAAAALRDCYRKSLEPLAPPSRTAAPRPGRPKPEAREAASEQAAQFKGARDD